MSEGEVGTCTIDCYCLQTVNLINVHDLPPAMLCGNSDKETLNTVYHFRCKNIFVVAINHENFIHEIIFTRVNNYYSLNLFAMLASYFVRWPSLDSYLQPRDGILGKSEQTCGFCRNLHYLEIFSYN